MTQPERFSCPFGQDMACATAVGVLGDREMEVQDAFVRYGEGERNAETAVLARKYDLVKSGEFGLAVLGLAAMALDSGITCSARCPIQAQIILRENMRGNPGV